MNIYQYLHLYLYLVYEVHIISSRPAYNNVEEKRRRRGSTKTAAETLFPLPLR